MRRGHAHTLALGARGDDVLALQSRLLSLGYDPGPLDGYFGYLTQEAVLAFQRDNGLRVDGIAGPRVFDLAQQPALPGRQRALVLGVGESINDAARHFGVNVDALRRINHLAPGARGFPGQRLVCRMHYVLATVTSTARGRRLPQRALPLLTALAVPTATVTAGELEACADPIELPAQTAERRHELWLAIVPAWRLAGTAENPMDIHLLLSRAKRRQAAAVELAALSRERQAGIWLDWGQPRWGDGPKLLAFMRLLRAELAKDRHPLMLTLPLPTGDTRWRWWLTDIDYKALSALADKVVLGAHYPAGLDSFTMHCQRLSALLEMLPAWKCLLGIGLRAEARAPNGAWLGSLPYPQAVTMAYLARARPKWDPVRKMLRAPVAASGQEHGASDKVLWLPGRDAVAERLALVHRFNLAGIAFDALGDEDPKVWDIVPQWIVSEHYGT